MNNQTNESSRSFGRALLVLVFLLECVALPLQFYLLEKNTDFTLPEVFIRLFSFFTVLTNFLVFVWSGILLFGKKLKVHVFFQRSTTITAITVYILIVGLVFNIILRPTQAIGGLHRLASEIFHSVVPVLVLMYWYVLASKHNMSWRYIFPFMIYPLLYMVYTLLHGDATGFYPYPFINVAQLGIEKAMQNGVYVLLAFIFLSLLLIGFGKLRNKESQ